MEGMVTDDEINRKQFHELELQAGARVRLHGLRSALQLNGALGRLCEFHADRGRWAVALSATGPPKLLKPENLEVIDSSPSACSSAVLESDELLLQALRALSAADLLMSVSFIAKRWNSIAYDDSIWLELCRRRWLTKAKRYHLTPERRAQLDTSWLELCRRREEDGALPLRHQWLQAYEHAEVDGKRKAILRDELTLLRFNFRMRFPSLLASNTFGFHADGMTVGHPSGIDFPWILDNDGVGLQWGPPQHMFPKGQLVRLPDWRWQVENVNVICPEADADECDQWLR